MIASENLLDLNSAVASVSTMYKRDVSFTEKFTLTDSYHCIALNWLPSNENMDGDIAYFYEQCISFHTNTSNYESEIRSKKFNWSDHMVHHQSIGHVNCEFSCGELSQWLQREFNKKK